MTHAVRFLKIALRHGSHDRVFELPDLDEPVVVSGPNGAGKSTLLEGLVRTLFGFNRRDGDDGHELEWRRPWSGEPGRGRVELRDASGEHGVVERDFSSNDVTVSTAGGSTELWRGDGNPAATNPSACDFRQRLRALVGFDRFEIYQQTAYIEQGGLLATAVNESLLRAAAGSPVDVSRALESIEQAHRRCTREPVAEGRPAAQKPRERERLLEQLAQLERELEAVRARELARSPLVVEQRRLASEIERLSATVEALEAAQPVLGESDKLHGEIAHLEERIAGREREAAELESARSDVVAARARLAELGDDPRLPEDFLERAAALEQLWSTRERVERRREEARRALGAERVVGRGWILLGLACAAGGALAWIVWPGLLVAAAVGIGLAGAGAAARLRKASHARRAGRLGALATVEQDLDEIDGSIEHQLQSVPGAARLTAATLGIHRAAFLRRREARASCTRATEAHTAALRRIANALRLGSAARLEHEAVLDGLRRALATDRNTRAEKRLRLDEISRMALGLPDGTRAEAGEVRRTLASRRLERARFERELAAVNERLTEHRPARAAVALEEETEELRQRLAAADEAADSCRLAYELLDEAHRSFRAGDQRRLLDLVSEHLARLSDGLLGPLEAPGPLDEARLHAFGRLVPLGHRPLSYGQWHLVQLAVRLGAAEFLGRWGVAVPLIVDEPFANLDEENAAAVWRQLAAVARSRQVIVATQETALLARLGIRPHIDLTGIAAAAGAAPSPGASPRRRA